MTFEEDFPNLKNKHVQWKTNKYYLTDLDTEHKSARKYAMQTIKKYCIDKQRVKEAIEKYLLHVACDEHKCPEYLQLLEDLKLG
jgi:hypothetical protein